MPFADKNKQKKYSLDYARKNKALIREKHRIYYAKPDIRVKKALYEKEYYKSTHGKERRLTASMKWYRKNIAKMRKYSREYWNRSENKIKNRDSKLRNDYGISLEDYKKMFDIQKGVCAICGLFPYHKTQRTLAVDHNHTTGKVRALLCHKCNSAIGMLNEDVQIIQKVIEYLNKHNGRTI